ncbi:sensor histidine kinase [Streptomyces fuscichromogenes]|uniref:histidine kinase n=1 Tax=Streptomyces fuscichromogenes TaxID=1324013 RepID=A0A917XD60_9ACTN|nr:sensor histidine kinase [Streptomyces fuscichromogenes]GGN10562.1 two-component sensor histidine kinase [Streptomyces fuscichromogenes]
MTTSLDRATGRHRGLVDAVTGLALLGCVTLGALLRFPGFSQPQEQWPAVAIAAVTCLALLRARVHPRAVATVAMAGTVATLAQGYIPTPLMLAPLMLALYWVAAETERRIARAFGLAAMAVVVISAMLDNPTTDMLLLRTVGPVLWLLLPLVGGSRARLRAAYLESVQARAAYAERTREEEARLRVAEERMRIARELHDVVAHHMAVANAQAGTARHLIPIRPEQALKLLDELTVTTSAALIELRATVGVLRQSGDPDAESLEPAPGLDRLPELVSTCASAGLDVVLTTEGEPRPLSPGVDLTAYRIIQEALTNVTKHGAGRGADVRLTYARSRLLISVTNDGTAAAVPEAVGGGFGLMGMRERAHSVGGDLRAGPRPDGGFEVTTALPLHSLAPEEPEAAA